MGATLPEAPGAEGVLPLALLGDSEVTVMYRDVQLVALFLEDGPVSFWGYLSSTETGVYKGSSTAGGVVTATKRSIVHPARRDPRDEGSRRRRALGV